MYFSLHFPLFVKKTAAVSSLFEGTAVFHLYNFQKMCYNKINFDICVMWAGLFAFIEVKEKNSVQQRRSADYGR